MRERSVVTPTTPVLRKMARLIYMTYGSYRTWAATIPGGQGVGVEGRLAPALTSPTPLPRMRGSTVPSGFFVANTASAEKAARQAEKHRARNVALRSRMRSAIRSVTAAIAAGNKETAQATYKEATPVIDALVNKQIVHRNKAARHKSRLAASIRKMQ